MKKNRKAKGLMVAQGGRNTDISSVPSKELFCPLKTQESKGTHDSPSKERSGIWSWQCFFVLVLKHWPFLWEAWGRGEASSYVNAQSRNNLSQPGRGFI